MSTTMVLRNTTPIEVLCEFITPALAITPQVDGAFGEYVITHVPSMHLVPPGGSVCLACARERGKRLAKLKIDWATVEPLIDSPKFWTAARQRSVRATARKCAHLVSWI